MSGAVQTIFPARGPKPAYLQSSPAVEAAMDGRRARSRPPWTKLKKPSSAKRNESWNRRAWPGLATCKSSRWCARGLRWGATILALAEAARNIRSVAGQILRSFHRRERRDRRENRKETNKRLAAFETTVSGRVGRARVQAR